MRWTGVALIHCVCLVWSESHPVHCLVNMPLCGSWWLARFILSVKGGGPGLFLLSALVARPGMMTDRCLANQRFPTRKESELEASATKKQNNWDLSPGGRGTLRTPAPPKHPFPWHDLAWQLRRPVVPSTFSNCFLRLALGHQPLHPSKEFLLCISLPLRMLTIIGSNAKWKCRASWLKKFRILRYQHSSIKTNRRPFEVWGTGQRDRVHTPEVSRGHIAAGEALTAHVRSGEKLPGKVSPQCCRGFVVSFVCLFCERL